MKTTFTVFSRILILTGLLALAGCGQDQDNGGETAAEPTSTPATESGDDMASTTEEQTASQPEPATTETDTSASEAEASDAAAADSAADAGGGETHTVTARATSYDPVVLKINPGDSVSWTNMSGHNVHFEKGNIPEGAEPWQTPLGDNVNKTFTKEGLYLYKCDPHFAMGMVGAIIVGNPTNVEAVSKNARGMYKRALAKAKSAIE